MIYAAALWLIAAPAGYLAGDVYNSRRDRKDSVLPIMCGLLPPMGAFIAIATLMEVTE